MTDCPDGLMRDQLPEYVHGTLAAAEAARVDGHLEVCAACREEVALLQTVRAVAAHRTPAMDVAAIVAALPAAPVAIRVMTSRPRWTAVRSWQYAAAAVLLLAVSSTTLWRAPRADGPARLADSTQAPARVGASSDTPAVVAVPARATSGMSFGGGLSDLSLDDLQALLIQMDSVKAVPSSDPAPMTPVIATTEGEKSL